MSGHCPIYVSDIIKAGVPLDLEEQLVLLSPNPRG